MDSRKPDPVDLMLEGRMSDATEAYLRLYSEALESGDRFIGADLIVQLHFSVAGDRSGSAPEDVTEAVEQMVMSALRERGVDVDEQIVQIVDDDIAIAKKGLLAGRKRSERSVEAVDREKSLRWKGA